MGVAEVRGETHGIAAVQCSKLYTEIQPHRHCIRSGGRMSVSGGFFVEEVLPGVVALRCGRGRCLEPSVPTLWHGLTDMGWCAGATHDSMWVRPT
jgi:hypothetical protein